MNSTTNGTSRLEMIVNNSFLKSNRTVIILPDICVRTVRDFYVIIIKLQCLQNIYDDVT